MNYIDYDETNIQSFEYETTMISDGNIVGTCELGKAEIQMLNSSNEYSTLKGSWINTVHGSFYIYDVEPIQEKVNIKLSCYDIKCKLDTKYNSLQHSFPCTLKTWRNSIFDDCDVQYDNSDFPNSDLVLEREPYIEEGASNRQVMKMIAQAAASSVITDSNDKFYFVWFENTIHVINDWTELTTERETSQPINVLVLGRGDVEDNVYYPTQLPANPAEFRIDNNDILDPQYSEQDLRYITRIPVYNQINGLSYIVYNMKTQDVENKLSIRLGHKIRYLDIYRNQLESYVMTKRIIYLGGNLSNDDNYEIILSAETINESSTDYSYGANIINIVRKVERKTDKLNGKIIDIVEEINDVTITTPTIESNNDIYLTQAKEDYAIEYKANGVCEQDETPTPSSPQEIRTIKGDNNNQLKIKVTGKNFWNLGNEYNFTSTVQTWHFLNGSQGAYGSNIGSKTTYKYFCKSGKKYIFQMYLENQLRGSSLVWSDETDSGITRLSSSSNTTQGLMVFKIIGKDDYVIPRVSVFANQQVSITGVMIEEVDDDVETPSPYELYKENIALINLKKENLFDKDNANILNASINVTNKTITSNANARSLYISCKSNTTYIISKVSSSRFVVISTETTPSADVVGTVKSYTEHSATNLTIKTGVNDKYIAVYYYASTIDTLTEQEILNSITIYESNNPTPYHELCNKDTLSIDSSGNCVINKKIGKVILNGSEDWEVQYSGDRHGWRTTVPNLKQTTSASQESYAISNYYESKSQDAAFNDTYGICNRTNQSQIIIKNNDITSTNDFKAWLSTHNTSVYYVLNTPETIILENTKIPLFEGINYITLVDDLETNTSITYYKKTPLSNQMRRLSERVQSVDENVSIISEEVDGHKTRLTEVDQRIDEISQQVEEDIIISKKVTNIGSITLQNAFETQLHKLVIKGNISVIEPQEGEYGYPLVPRDDLVPSDSLTPSNPVPHSEITVIDDSILVIDNVEYELDFDFLNYIDDNVCDKYVIEDGNCYVIRKIGIDSNGNKYAIDDEVIEPKAPISLIVNKNSTIHLKSTEDAILEATYLLDNPYTNSFTTNYKVKTEIQQAKDEINAQVVGNDEVVAKMNLALHEGQGVIEFVSNQFLVKSDNLDIDRYGNVDMRGGNIVLQNGSQILGDDGLKSTILVLSNICSQSFVGGSTLLPMGFSLVGKDQYDNAIVNKDWLSLEFEIPEDFVITSAKIILTHVPVNYTGYNTETGWCRKLKLYKSNNGLNQSITINDMYYVFENSDIGYTEIQNAFGQNGFTGNSSYGEEKPSIELKDYITTGFNKFKIQSDENTPTTLAQCYQYSGACMATLYITGYTKFNEVESSNRSLSNLNQQNEIELRNNETNLNEEENNEQTRTINQQLEIDNTNLNNKEKENKKEESDI